jgi:hypothetical protein
LFFNLFHPLESQWLIAVRSDWFCVALAFLGFGRFVVIVFPSLWRCILISPFCFPLLNNKTIFLFDCFDGLFAWLIVAIVQDNQPESITMLKSSEASIVNRIYFQALETIELFDPDEPVTTGPATKLDLDDGFNPDPVGGSTGVDDTELDSRTIAGIAAAAGFVFILIADVLCAICRNGDEHEQDQEEMKNNSAFGNSLATPPHSQGRGLVLFCFCSFLSFFLFLIIFFFLSSGLSPLTAISSMARWFCCWFLCPFFSFMANGGGNHLVDIFWCFFSLLRQHCNI